ncbi:unnamed protein product [Rotaria sp. Silwood1]|nr:unnamed protein product [Rotaria sp. Silwood1]CAF3352256.1 unnamed protein product [Rotaria sp. Silwood1]CAF3375333.1 unnamed protein product [Rotaria sp. Silwood1]CAF4719710.1 unnamed protein product [Rotaria sp. Silwood1]CAF4739235.1 unnamed protein product [Rotaria sp. Silwood1]
MVVELTSSTTYSCSSSSSCGCSTNSATLARIVGGEAAASQTWGWAVSLKIGGSLCGGSIISASWVLTAAHCVSGASASQITVYAGSTSRLTGTQNRSVSSVTSHPSYNAATFVNDIALLLLSTPLNMTDPAVSTICLPSVSSATLSAGEWPPAGTTVVAVGWGRLSEGGSISSTLQQVTMQTVDRQSSTYTCQGDSGGPLMAFTSNNQWVLVGATSSGIGCAQANYAGSYTRVAAYQSWISTTTVGQYTSSTSSSLISSTTEIDLTAKCAAPAHFRSTLSLELVSALLFLYIIESLRNQLT